MDFSPISINDNGGKFEKEVDSNGVWQNGDAHAKLIVDEDWRSTESTSSDHEEEEEEAEDTETEEAYQDSLPASTASAGTTSTEPEDVHASNTDVNESNSGSMVGVNIPEMNNRSKLASNIKELLERKSVDAISVKTELASIQTQAKFSSFAEFDTAFELWKQVNHHPFRVASSETLRQPDGTVNETFKYRYIVYHCAHYGQPRMRGVGKRPNQNYLPCGCRAMLRLNFNWAENCLRITTLNELHTGHEISADSYAKISTKVRKGPSPGATPVREERRSPVIRRPQPQLATAPIKCEGPSPSPLGSSSSATTPSPKTPLAMLAQNMNMGNGLLAHHKENALFPPHQLLPLLQGMLGLHNFSAFLSQPHHGVVAPQPRPAEPTPTLAALHAAAAAASPQALAGLMAKLAPPPQQTLPPVSLSSAAFSVPVSSYRQPPPVVAAQPPPSGASQQPTPLDLSSTAPPPPPPLNADKRSDEERFQEMHGTLQAVTDHLMQCRGMEFDAKLSQLNFIVGAWGVRRHSPPMIPNHCRIPTSADILKR